MITDAMLREAAGEAERFLLAHLPEPQPHQFSPRFERRMQKLISRAKHPVRHQVLRYVAAVLLAILTLFGSILAVSPEARATVTGWVRSIYKNSFQYTNENTEKPVIAEYDLTAIPDGYSQLSVVDRSDGKTYLFADDSGNILHFSYVHAEKFDSLFIKAVDYEQKSGYVNGVLADIYLSKKEDESSVIVWQDRKSNTIFRIHAMADADELIAMAESVQKIN